MKILNNVFRSGLVAILVASPVWADDTDIYLNNSAELSGIPKVMLSLEVRANQGAAECTIGKDCVTHMGILYGNMDLYDAKGELGSDGFMDKDQEWFDDTSKTIQEQFWPGTDVFFLDVLRTVLYTVLVKVQEKINNSPDIAGIEVGLMAMHDQAAGGTGNKCKKGSGPDLVPFDCSTGAYVLQGFVDITNDANLAQLMLKLGSIPSASVKVDNHWGKGVAHPYQASALYFEFFRYLTGQAVYNGFLGFEDYGSGESDGNLYHDENSTPTNDILIDLHDGDGLQPLLAPDPNIMDVTTAQLTSNSVGNAKYISPLDVDDECSGVYMINTFFNVDAGGDDGLTTAVGKDEDQGGLELNLSAVGELPGAASPVNTTAEKSGAIMRTLLDSDLGSTAYPGMPDIAGKQSVTSYWLAEKNDQNVANYFAFAGGTGTAYGLNNPEQALDIILGIFEEILSVSTTFVAASVPTNVFNRAQAVDNIYFALFQAEKTPRWNGNVKKLKIAEIEVTDPITKEVSTFKIIAQAPINPPTPAISSIDGRIKTDALTFWTDPTAADVVAFDPNDFEVSGKDGRSITRGGAGQQIPGYLDDTIGADNTTGSRQMFTENPAVPGTGLALETDMNLTGISSYLDPNDILDEDTERQLIGWIRGMDAFNTNSAKASNSRPWLMADPMHSRPLVVNYGARGGSGYTADNPDIRLFYGTNDGVIRFVRNTVTGSGDNESGEETASFIPLEMLGMQYTLAQNKPQSAPPHPYGMDGEAVSFIYDKYRDGNIENTKDGDYVWVFIGQRRGGPSLYAFDLTDPDSPSLKWKITNQTPGFEQLALTFSTPQAVSMDLGDTLGTDDGDDNTPVLIFAGGYNGGWNGSSRVGKDAGAADDTIGNAIYVVNADTGDLIWKAVGPDGSGSCTDLAGTVSMAGNYCVDGSGDTADMTAFTRPSMVDSIPSAIAVVDSDNNNVVDRAYVGDSGGNVWRIELTENEYKIGTALRDKNNWYVTKLGEFGGSGGDDRRFFHAPDYVKALESETKNKYDGVVITSGDRALPRGSTVQDYAFMMKDTLTVTNAGAAIKLRPPFVTPDPDGTYPTGLTDITDICINGAETEVACKALDLANGWKLELEGSGEKGLSSPLITSGVVLFTTYLPNDGTAANKCEPSEGSGAVYLVNLADGSAAFDLAAQLNVWTKADRFQIVGPGIPGDVIPWEDQVLIPGKGIGGRQIFTVPGRSIWRVYWKEEEVDQ